ncbi:hypothetical protein C8R43DRAFT_1014953 [Mycena crocata]|nr:hypothetical protein C8R43DRAFT_1014953 [Mycena crocata]
MQLGNPFILQFLNLRAFRLRITIHLHGIQQHRDMSHPVTSHPSGFSSTSATYSSFPLWVLLVVVRNDPVHCPGKVRTSTCTLHPDAPIYLHHSSHAPLIPPAHRPSFRRFRHLHISHPVDPAQATQDFILLLPGLYSGLRSSGPVRTSSDRLGPSALLCYPVLLCHSVYPLSSYSTFGLPFVIFKSLVPF